jgi:hypothetical protein
MFRSLHGVGLILGEGAFVRAFTQEVTDRASSQFFEHEEHVHSWDSCACLPVPPCGR